MTTMLRHGALTLVALALLAGCDGKNDEPPAKPAPTPHAIATYTPATWQDLPATAEPDLLAGFKAWREGCQKLARNPAWADTCAAAANVADTSEAVQQFMQTRLDVYGLRAADGNANGLITGYYEPIYPGSLTRAGAAQVPVYGVPEDMITVDLSSVYPELKGKRLRGRLDGRVLKPYDTAEVIARDGIKAPILAYLTDPMDLQFLQVQGSGRIQLADGRLLRVGYADQNGHPYRPIGRWLVEQGALNKADVTMGSIHAWAEADPQRVPELLASNPSYVFFSTRPDSNEGPRGSLNVPLTAGYSVAIDRKVIPLGSLLWLSTTRPDGTPVTRPVGAQDTGGAITGEVRADLFWGTGPLAGELAGNMKQQGQIWLLWPKGQPLPDVPEVP